MDALPTRKQITHERIVETAARAIRRAGFAGIGVADIMKEAGLTHGGFYAHFPSRDALLCEAVEHAGAESAARLAARTSKRQARGESALRAFVEGYLSEWHATSAESGCPVAALASEIPRQSRALRQASAQRVRALIRAVQEVLPAAAPDGTAAVVAGQMLGALQMARALGDTGEGKAVLRATRRALLERYDLPQQR